MGVDALLQQAASLHEAALDPHRWEQVVSVAKEWLATGRNSGTLSPEQLDWLDAIVANATRICAEAVRLANAGAMAGSAIDTIGMGILVLDSRGGIVSANRPAKRLLESAGASLKGPDGDAEAAASFDAAPSIPSLPASLSRSSTSEASGPAVFRLPRPNARPLELLAVPVRAPDDPFSLPDARTIVFMADPDSDDGPDEQELTAAFDLTATEARLAVRLLRGQTLEDAAHALGIKISTARTHLAHVFLKTGTSRQPELMRLLLSMPRRDGEQDSDP